MASTPPRPNSPARPSPCLGLTSLRAVLWLVLLGWCAWMLASPFGSRPVEVPVRTAPPEPEWIWHAGEPQGDEVLFFARSFGLAAPAEVAMGAFTADNTFELLLDGELLASGDEWTEPVVFGGSSGDEAPRVLAPGSHTVAVRATNGSGPGGLLGRLSLVGVDGSRTDLATDATWTLWEEQPAGWPQPFGVALAEAGSPATSLGPSSGHSGPWGNVMAPREAPDPATFSLADGFVCERLYSARDQDGSWASMTFGPVAAGGGARLFVSPERGDLLAFDLPADLVGGAPADLRYASPSGGSHAGGLGDPRVIDLPVHAAQGLEWAHDSLYVSVSAGVENGGGMWRLRDVDDDGRLDDAERLVAYEPYSEHGAHGVRLTPDGSLVLVQGNYASGPLPVEGRPAPVLDLTPTAHVQEDVLLPRIWDPRGHAHGIMAPGGELWRFDADGTHWSRESVGMRNAYDIAVSKSGEVFTYDSDMEWDHGLPWYRSPAVYHLVPGADFGWRSGSAKWPRAYPDTLPAVVETDLSSPTGVELGESGTWGAPWDQVLFLGDWAWGRILAAHLVPEGASYSGTTEVFLEGRGLTITDLEFGPDGNLWFTTGGRGTQSGLYRVRQSDRPDGQPEDRAAAQAGELASTKAHVRRRELEATGRPADSFNQDSLLLADPFFGPAWRASASARWEPSEGPGAGSDVTGPDRPWPQPSPVAFVWEALAQVLHDPEGLALPLPIDSADKGHYDTWYWALDRVVPLEQLVGRDGTGASAGARAGMLREAMLRLRVAMLLELRAPELAAELHGSWQPQLAEALGAKRGTDTDMALWEEQLALAEGMDPLAVSAANRDIAVWKEQLALATGRDPLAERALDPDLALLDRERARLAVAIETPGLPALLVPRTAAPLPQEERLHYLLLLRLVESDWTPELRRAYFESLHAARSFQGGASLMGYVAAIEKEALTRVPDSERPAIDALLFELDAKAAADAAIASASGAAGTGAAVTGRDHVRTWTTTEAAQAVEAAPPGDPARGRALFSAATCVGCHRIAGQGGALGPDLSGAARRFSRHDLLQAIVEPDRDRSDQYGLVRMPTGLLDTLDADELADLMSFLEQPE